jgi:5'-3' exonuclease
MSNDGRCAETELKLKILRRRFIRVSDADLERVWSLMRSLGVQHIVAPGEADALCAQMVLKRKAYACVSDDTDLLVYGCCRVLRHINLFDQTITMYDMNKILNILGISMKEFRQICVISGTDYNTHSSHSLRHALQLFKQYKLCAQQAEHSGSVFAPDFYTWLHHNCCAINPRWRFDYAAMTAIDEMFNITNTKFKLQVSFHNPGSNSIDDELLHRVMAHENFIFV